MHSTVKNLIDIEKNIKSHLSDLKINNQTKIIAVSKTFPIEKILPLIEHVVKKKMKPTYIYVSCYCGFNLYLYYVYSIIFIFTA